MKINSHTLVYSTFICLVNLGFLAGIGFFSPETNLSSAFRVLAVMQFFFTMGLLLVVENFCLKENKIIMIKLRRPWFSLQDEKKEEVSQS